MNVAEGLLALHLRELGLDYSPQYAYAPGRKFRADFAVWRRRRAGQRLGRQFALIEVTGGVYTRQSHGSIKGVLADNTRLYHAFRAGWPMIRFTPDQVKSGEAKRLIAEAMT